MYFLSIPLITHYVYRKYTISLISRIYIHTHARARAHTHTHTKMPFHKRKQQFLSLKTTSNTEL
jgi:hypothetical protein